VIAGGVPHHVVPDLSGPTGAAAASHQTLPLVRPDRATGGVRADRVGAKLSSRAGAHQKAAVPAERASRTHASPDGRSRAVKAGRPLARETSAGGARRVVRSLGSAWRVSGSQGSDANVGQPSPGSGGRHGGWPQNRPEVSSQSSASWARRVDEPGAGIGRSVGLCSWIVLVAEVDESHLVQAATATGNRRGKRWV